MKQRNLFVQSANESSPIPIIGDTTHIRTTASNDTSSADIDNTVDLEEVTPVQSKGKQLIGPILGGLGIFIILVFYLLGLRKEERERKEKALEATRKEEMKRKLLKDNMNINVSGSKCVSIESILFLCSFIFLFLHISPFFCLIVYNTLDMRRSVNTTHR